MLITVSVALLTYLSCGTGGAATAFTWFQNLTTVANLFTWISISIAYIQFHRALKAQGIDRNTLVFKAPWQPYLGWASLIFFSLVTFFNGFDTFSPFSVNDFITAYIGIPIYFLLFAFWKFFKRTKWVNPAEADLHTGKAALDAEHWPEQKPRNIFERIWFWIA